MLHAAHIRAARALLGWHQDQLAKRSKVGLATIQRLERSPPGPVMAHVATVVKIAECFEGKRCFQATALSALVVGQAQGRRSSIRLLG